MHGIDCIWGKINNMAASCLFLLFFSKCKCMFEIFFYMPKLIQLCNITHKKTPARFCFDVSLCKELFICHFDGTSAYRQMLCQKSCRRKLFPNRNFSLNDIPFDIFVYFFIEGSFRSPL